MFEKALPTLSAYDPETSAEGALDPLGMYAIGDSLARKLVPDVRERMSHPRYLTAMAVGSYLTKDYLGEDVLAADGESDPTIVYEWHVVEGLVRSRDQDSGLQGLPGIQKARDAIRDGVPISSSRYLKTASVFGLHGVYKVLSSGLDITDEGMLGDSGYELISVWEQEQGLRGFVSGEGPGLSHRTNIQAAIQDGLKKGAVGRSPSWQEWEFFGEHLFPNLIPPLEAGLIAKVLFADNNSPRSQLLRYLSTKTGQDIFLATQSERDFHKALRLEVDKDTGDLLDAIFSYEIFCRVLQDAFEDCLYLMSVKRGPVKPSELAREPACVLAHGKVPDLFGEVSDRLEPFNETVRFVNTFAKVSERTDSTNFVEHLLEHHISNQKNKPPNGKNPWFERMDDGSCVVRAGYKRDEPGQRTEEYVHTYRTWSLLSFLSDLKMLEDR